MTSPKLYVVRTNTGTFRSEHDTPEQAQAAADTANKQAETLGIVTRYEAGVR